MDAIAIARVIAELIAVIVIPILARRNATAGAVVQAFAEAVAAGAHGPTQDALARNAEARGVADHPAVQEASQ